MRSSTKPSCSFSRKKRQASQPKPVKRKIGVCGGKSRLQWLMEKSLTRMDQVMAFDWQAENDGVSVLLATH